MKIIHLSDTHVGRDDNKNRLMRVIQDVLALGNAQNNIVVHTGDLIDRGQVSQMQTGRALMDILAANGMRVLLSPGNHDYGDGKHVDPLRAERFREYLRPYISGDGPARFPVVTLAADCAFIGLDSSAAEMCLLKRALAEGQLGRSQLLDLNEILDDPALRGRYKVVYLHHHPFLESYAVRPDFGDGNYVRHMFVWGTRRFRRLKDAYSLLQCVRDRIDLLLFGHQHFGLDYGSEARRYGIPLALDGGSTTDAERETDRLRYRIIDTQKGSVETRFVRC